MTVEELISSLEGVKQIGRGWRGKCPVHDDNNPSLSIREGDRGILVKCWAGCSLEEICEAVGIQVRELFYDTQCAPHQIRRRQAERQYEKAKYEVARMVNGFQIDAIREAERFLQSARGIDISQWSAERLDHEMNLVCDALTLILEE